MSAVCPPFRGIIISHEDAKTLIQSLGEVEKIAHALKLVPDAFVDARKLAKQLRRMRAALGLTDPVVRYPEGSDRGSQNVCGEEHESAVAGFPLYEKGFRVAKCSHQRPMGELATFVFNFVKQKGRLFFLKAKVPFYVRITALMF